MKKNLFTTTIVLQIICIIFCNFNIQAGELLLVKNRKANSIIIAKDDRPAQKAAKKLQKYLKEITGINIPIKSSYSGQKTKIFISYSNPVKGFSIDTRKLKTQGFIIKSMKNAAILMGKDAEGMENSVYFFLRKYCGVRWYFPGKLGTIIPRRQTLAIADNINDIQNPDFVVRELWVNKKWGKHNLLGNSCPRKYGHAFLAHVPPEKYWKTNPEYFAEIKGKRQCPAYLNSKKRIRKWCGWQLCTSNPKVVDIVAENVCKTFAKYPKIKVVGISPNDGGGWCECPKCKALGHGKNSGLTKRLFTYANAVAKKVAKKYPDKYVLMFAYGDYVKVPENLKLEPNIIVYFTYMGACRTSPTNQARLRELEKWGKISSHIWIYEYLMVEGWVHHDPPVLIDTLGWEISYFHKIGVDGFIAQAGNDWAMNGANYYLSAQLLWDSSLNSQKIMEEYYSLLFGKAASAIQKYHKIKEQAWTEGVRSVGKLSQVTDVIYLNIYTDKIIAECRKCFVNAKSLVSPNSKAFKRIEMFHNSLTFTENHAAILKATKKLSEIGIPINYHFKHGNKLVTKKEKLQRLEDAEKAIKQQFKFIETQKKTGTIAYSWLHSPGNWDGRYIPRQKKKLKRIERYLKSFSPEQNRIIYKLPAMWEFRLDPKNTGIKQKWFKETWSNNVKKITVPAFWNKTPSYSKYSGVAWYQATFEVNKNNSKKEIFINFDAVDAEADVYINGKFAGKHPYQSGSWQTPFKFDISKLVIPNQKNTITVRVDGHGRNSGIWQPVTVYSPKEDNLVLNGDFSNGTFEWHARPSLVVQGKKGFGKCAMRTSAGQITQRVCLVAGQKYKFSAWMKTDKLANKAYVDIYLAGGGKCYLGNLNKNSDWKYFEKTFIAQKDLNIITLRLRNKGKAYFDNISITRIKK